MRQDYEKKSPKSRNSSSGVLDLIARHFGENVEVVLHDFSAGVNSPQSLVDIRNGHVTGRKIGDCASKHGMQAVKGEMIDGDIYNEIIYTEKGTILRGSSYSIKDEDGKVVGSICINQDITDSVKYENYLRQVNGYNTHPTNTQDVLEVMNEVVEEAFIAVGKHPATMTKEDKIAFIKFLDDRGMFLISKSGPRICEILGISKFTLYNYLEIIRSGTHEQG